MNERSEKILFLGLGAAALALFALKLLRQSPLVDQLVPALSIGTVCAVILLISLAALRHFFPVLSISSFLELVEGEDAAILSRQDKKVLIKAFEVIDGPPVQISFEQSDRRSLPNQTPLEALAKVGVKVRVMTSMNRPQHEASSGQKEDSEHSALLRTVVLVFEAFTDGEIDEAKKEIERQYEVAQSSILTSTRNCRVRPLKGEELLEFLEEFYLYKREEGGHLSGLISLKDVSSLHFQEGQRVDIVGGSYIPPPQNQDSIMMGNVLFAGAPGPYCEIGLSSLSKHMTIFGCTGAGKSNTAKVLMKRIIAEGIPVLVLDFHNEYLDLINSIGGSVIRLTGESHIDVLHPFNVKDFNEHVSIITDVFNQSYRFSPSQYFIFRENLMQAFAAGRLTGSPPTMEHLVKNIEQYDTKSFYEHETKFALLRRLIPLIEGEGKRAFVVGRAVGIGEIAEKPCVVALGDLKDAELRNLLGVMLLALIYELRLSEGPSSLKHVTIIEESQNVVPYRLRTEDATIFEKMFFEMRKYGESLVLLAQFPTQIFPDVVKSAGIKVVHRLTEAGEAEMIMDVMGLSRSLYSQLKYLPEGRAVVLTDNLDGPITVQIPLLETHSPTSQLQLTHPMSKA